MKKEEISLINIDFVREKVGRLVKSMGISKTKLGEVLAHKEKDADPRVKINRASRFLKGAQKKISLQEINALALFFQKPVEWFLFDDRYTFALASSETESVHPLKPLSEIRKNLERMGFDQDFIEAQLKQLKAMEAYKALQDE